MRPLFSRRRSHTSRGALGIEHGRRVRSRDARGTRRSKDPDRVAGGYKAALANPNTTREGRQHAKHELEAMGRSQEARVSFTTKIKRALGIRSTPRRRRHEAAVDREREHYY